MFVPEKMQKSKIRKSEYQVVFSDTLIF